MLDFSVDTADWPAAALQQRVVITTGSYDHAVDGVALTLNRLAAHLLRQGHEVLVLSPGRGSWLREHRPVLRHAGTLVRIPSVPLPIWSEYRLTFGLGRRARAALAAFGPTVLHVAVQDALGHAAVRWAEGNGVPVLCSHHTRWNAYLSYYALARGMRAPLESFMWCCTVKLSRPSQCQGLLHCRDLGWVRVTWLPATASVRVRVRVRV